MTSFRPNDVCTCGPCGCESASGVDRRGFLKLVGVGAMATGWTNLDVMAGPFEENEYLRAIPADKKLDPSWVRSLLERGEKQTYSDRQALERIGMPVGGLFAGTVYLAGDGRLWLWDIFNRDQEGVLPRGITPPPETMVGDFLRGGVNFVHPAPLTQPFEVGFRLDVDGKTRGLDASGFSHVTFDGRYPIGRVAYRDSGCSVEVDLEAFSPFIPLNANDSSLPATVMSYTVRNAGSAPVRGQLEGYLANPVCLDSRKSLVGERKNRVVRRTGVTAIEYSAQAARQTERSAQPRPDIRFEDFERPTYEGWTVEGVAFGKGPIAIEDVPDYQVALGAEGKQLVNSHATAPGDDVAGRDAKMGRLISKPFKIERHFIALLLGGGSHPDKTGVNLLVDGKKVDTMTGQNDNAMRRRLFRVEKYEGRTAQLEIFDQVSGPWGNVGVDDIVFTDVDPSPDKLEEQRDFGTMTLALLDDADQVEATARIGAKVDVAAAALTDDQLTGAVGRSFRLGPGEAITLNFVVAWHFPNFYARGCGNAKVGHFYATLHASALAVVDYISQNFERLAGATRAWVTTWYDSSLPYWLLDRTFANTAVLATTTCYRFADGRFWGWEGVGCCEGTCTHVWHYAQAIGRLFPEVERDTRSRVDFGLALHDDGAIGHRAFLKDSMFSADDGQCGRILGALREHQMSADDTFLRSIWPQVKRAIEFLIRKDGNDDGMIEDAQPNTLDAAWYGKISFLASLYLAALRAGEEMAQEVDDPSFAQRCRTIAERGAQSILQTHNGEFFVQIEDPAHSNEIGIGPGCYIDQVFGQTWAHWLALGRLFDRDKQLSALRALWKYNFVPDVGPFRQQFKRGRWYAMAGDAGLIMCSWPKGGQNPAFKDHWQYMYFNECMTGFEWQAAAHMIWESYDQPDLLEKGLAISRAIHDRYSAALRNPYNEIECCDHYARSMASYGVYQAVCGFNCHGPRGHIEFAPRLQPEEFRAAFVAAQGWGSFQQSATNGKLAAQLEVAHGEMRIKSIRLRRQAPVRAAMVDGVALPFEQHEEWVVLTLPADRLLKVGDRLSIELV